MNQYTHIERDLPVQVENNSTEQSMSAVENQLREQQTQINKLQRDIARLKNTLDTVIARLQR